MSCNKSFNSFNILQNPDHKTNFRTDFIKALLEDNKLEPLINVEDVKNENFLESLTDNNDNKSRDTKKMLKKEHFNFSAIISKTQAQLDYVKSGAHGHTFKGIGNSPEGEFNFAVKVVAFPKLDYFGKEVDINDITRPENAEIKMIKLLSYFVINDLTPHIVLPIGTFNTKIDHFVNLLEEDYIDKNSKNYNTFIENYKKDKFHNIVSILISEWANKGDLLDFLKSFYKKLKLIHWKVLFFQIISTLAIIQTRFPAFRHNDFKANNILIHKISANKRTIYRVDGTEYSVPSIGRLIKIWDFDFSCIPNYVNNSKIGIYWTKEINVTATKNRYYDIHYFFNTLIRKGFLPEIMTCSEVPIEVKEFINRVVPAKFKAGPYIHKKGRILINDEYMIPSDILNFDPFFEELKLVNVNKKKQINNPVFDKVVINKQQNIKIIPEIVKGIPENVQNTKTIPDNIIDSKNLQNVKSIPEIKNILKNKKNDKMIPNDKNLNNIEGVDPDIKLYKINKIKNKIIKNESQIGDTNIQNKVPNGKLVINEGDMVNSKNIPSNGMMIDNGISSKKFLKNNPNIKNQTIHNKNQIINENKRDIPNAKEIVKKKNPKMEENKYYLSKNNVEPK